MCRTSGDDQRGAALLLVLGTCALITAIAASLIVAVSTETLITGSGRAAQETIHAADAGLERTIHDLAAIPDWSVVLASPPTLMASFDDGAAVGKGPDGRSLSMAALGAERQASSNTTSGPAVFGPDSPVWRLFGHAALAAVLPPGLVAQPAYLIIWVADDGLDVDGDPAKDSNGRILVHVESFGVNGARRSIDAAVSRSGLGAVRLLAWKASR
jgi:hypothetical protein